MATEYWLVAGERPHNDIARYELQSYLSTLDPDQIGWRPVVGNHVLLFPNPDRHWNPQHTHAAIRITCPNLQVAFRLCQTFIDGLPPYKYEHGMHKLLHICELEDATL